MKRYAIQTAMALIGAGIFMGAPSTMAGTRTLYSDDGLSEISVPDDWRVTPHIGKTAALRVTDPRNDGYLLVNTYPPGETKPVAFEQLAEDLGRGLLEALEDGQISKPRKLTFHGRPAVEYEITGRIGEDRFAYLSVLVDGRAAKHHLVGWSLEAGYKANRSALRKVAASFRESAKRRAARERIELAFDWTGLTESRFSHQGKHSKRGETFELQTSGTTTIRPRGEAQLLISTQVLDYSMNTSPNAKDKNKDDYMQNLLQQTMTQIPDYVVGIDGSFAGIENMGAYYARVEQALLTGLPGESTAVQAQAKQYLKRLISEEGLNLTLQDGWNNHVANWAGGAYAVGETYTYASQYQAPALGDTPFPMTITQQLTGRVPCHKEDPQTGCVRLVQISRVSDPGFNQAMNRFVNKTLKDLAGEKADKAGVAVDSTEIVKTVTLVADPRTMLPHEVITSDVTTTVVREKGRAETARDVNESVTRYMY